LPVRALCEAEGIPVAWRGELPPLHRVREIAAFLDRLAGLAHASVAPDGLAAWLPADATPWRQVLADLIADWRVETGDVPAAASRCLEFCYESLGESRRDRTLGQGVLLSTLHGAKGLEFPHVLIADGPGGGSDPQEQRRLFYVGMTRARETLTIGRLPGGGNPAPALFDGDWLLRSAPDLPAPPVGILARRYALLTPEDIDLGFAGRRAPGDPIHACIACLPTGAALRLSPDGEAVLLSAAGGVPVARLSRRAAANWLPRLDSVESARVLAWLRRRSADGEPEYRDACRSEVWEYPLTELAWRADRAVCPEPVGPPGAGAEIR
jgi:ATP-dependent DNA helicase RecQ